jgi:acyl-CoA thioesterase I
MKLGKTKLLAIMAIFIISTCALILFENNINTLTNKTKKIVRVACVGDSITEWTKYPDHLQDLLGEDYLVENFGVAGSTVLRSSDKPYMNQTAFERSMEFQPTIVIIMLGTNDAKKENYYALPHFPNDYEQLINQYEALPDDQLIWIVTPPPIYNETLGPSNSHLENDVIPRIDQVANDMSLPEINVNAALSNHPDYFVDGIHPNDEGAQAIANEINDNINSSG